MFPYERADSKDDLQFECDRITRCLCDAIGQFETAIALFRHLAGITEREPPEETDEEAFSFGSKDFDDEEVMDDDGVRDALVNVIAAAEQSLEESRGTWHFYAAFCAARAHLAHGADPVVRIGRHAYASWHDAGSREIHVAIRRMQFWLTDHGAQPPADGHPSWKVNLDHVVFTGADNYPEFSDIHGVSLEELESQLQIEGSVAQQFVDAVTITRPPKFVRDFVNGHFDDDTELDGQGEDDQQEVRAVKKRQRAPKCSKCKTQMKAKSSPFGMQYCKCPNPECNHTTWVTRKPRM